MYPWPRLVACAHLRRVGLCRDLSLLVAVPPTPHLPSDLASRPPHPFPPLLSQCAGACMAKVFIPYFSGCSSSVIRGIMPELGAPSRIDDGICRSGVGLVARRVLRTCGLGHRLQSEPRTTPSGIDVVNLAGRVSHHSGVAIIFAVFDWHAANGTFVFSSSAATAQRSFFSWHDS